MHLKWYKVNIGLVLLIALFVLNLFLIYGLLYCNRLSSDAKNNLNKSSYAKTISDIKMKEGLNSILSEIHIKSYVSSNVSNEASTKMAFSDIDFALGRWDTQRLYKLYDFALIGNEYKVASDMNCVCLATQSSVERIHSIIQVADHWNGPISLAVFIAGTDEFLILQYYITYLRACFHRIRKNVVFHIAAPAKKLPKTDTQKRLTSESFNCQYPERTLRKLLKYRSTETIQWRLKNVYPQNHMRNLARKGCESRYVFLTDVDIIPSKNIVKQLNHFLENNKCKNQCAFVIPTYEIDVRVRFPGSKKELLLLVKKGLARPFHEKVFIYNQYATNFSRWQLSGTQPEKETYISHNVTNFEFLYEPFYVALDNVPAHDERFVGYGFTRNSQVYEMYIAGYEFYVLSPIFTCHWGLQKKKTRPSWREQQNNVNRKRFEGFKKEIFARYGSSRFKKLKKP